ncbi:lipopolysaccharide biosynthesis glycosyltransferase [Anaerosolibacter carboniphilus]|uniref:Lipopolysaccharide biosynthesis glycosyltransferase n=1 Tax=Anaerosolibacter carboniphilus TaxID=1417629 RepID=A0A841KUJ7_9FIRM|nr:lipopolysaccharide biosynthesis glycosyltransferase [Anaerosolibacter carboniphilus]
MNILVTLNSNYIKPLRVMLNSLLVNNPEESFDIYIMHSSLTDKDLNYINQILGDTNWLITSS